MGEDGIPRLWVPRLRVLLAPGHEDAAALQRRCGQGFCSWVEGCRHYPGCMMEALKRVAMLIGITAAGWTAAWNDGNRTAGL